MYAQPIYALVYLLVVLVTPQQPTQFAELNIFDDFIQSGGVWLPDNLTEKNEPIPSVEDVACYRHGGTILVNSDAYCIDGSNHVWRTNGECDVLPSFVLG